MSSIRTFIPEVETVYHKDYQCDYYRGVIIDTENMAIFAMISEIGHIKRPFA